ncbi:recombinase family protein [Virgibacillus sp. NKC19-16]|uniref:recombinase family protein n=1 Tax=Virgibacillus salidurans TaxID=2831673 RepID=UPI001F181415|nr:recombinase family protein [Virgibacillus sp. NKC19-16]UJL46831.1 recombinase family protein [Virgibacillus sp. NKC19-16]
MKEKRKIVRTLYRVSTNKQLDKDDIPIQRFACKEFLKGKEEWYYDEENSYVEKGVSGFKKSSKERNVLQTLMNDASNGDFDILLVYMFDRIGRQEYDTPFILKTLDNLGIELWSVEEGRQSFKDHSDDLINFIRFWQASGESKKTSLRVKESLKQKILDGKFTGGSAPYGYKLVQSGQFNKKGKELMMLVRSHEEAKIVTLIYLLSNKKGYGGNRIAKYLNENDIKTRNGNSWRATTVDYVLRNPVYKGYLVSSRTSVGNNGKARTNKSNEWVQSREKIEELEIIDEDIWEEVQKQRNGRNYKKSGDKNTNLSVVFCKQKVENNAKKS